MKSKTRTSKINNENPDSLLQIPEHFKEQSNHQIDEIINKFNTALIVEHQISSIHDLINIIKKPSKDNHELILKILVHLFVNSDSRNAVKKTVLRSIKHLQTTIELSAQILLLIETVNAENHFVRHNFCVNSINECFNNFPDGVKAVSLVVNDVYEYLIKVLKYFVDHLCDVSSPIDQQTFYNYIHNATRALVSVSQQCDNNQIKTLIPLFMNEIIEYCVKMFNNPGILFDTKNNCGILLITALNCPDENGYISMLQLTLNQIDSVFNINHSDVNDDIVISCIYAGVLNTVDPNKLCDYSEHFEESFIFKMCEKLLDISKHSADKPPIILGVNRALLLVSKALKTLNPNDFKKILTFLLENVWTQLDHYIDTIRHVSKSILSNFVKIAFSYKENGNDILSYIIENIFKCLNAEKRAKYVAISVISNEIGCSILLLQKPELMSLIMLDLSSDNSSQTYIISCCENLMRQYLKEVDESIWFAKWVTPIITKLKSNLNYETNVQDLLITAIKLKPDILDKIVSELNYTPTSNEIILSTILKCTIAARKLGIQSKTEDVKKWRNILSYDIIEKAKCDQNDEIRISCLSLIVESHKTTEIFNNFELNFIVSYLHYNINAQEPSTKQRILFLIIKFLSRYMESYYAIVRDYKKINVENNTELESQYQKLKQHKNDYEHYIFNLRVSIFENLFSRSSYSRRNNCLEIITMLEPIVKDVLKNCEFTPPKIWKREYVNSLLLCLEDSYEINQQLATKLLLNAPVEYIKIHDKESTKKFLDRALLLTNKVQPAYSQSAAYFFEIVLCSPVIVELITEEMPGNYNKCSKEFVLIRYLFSKLQEQAKTAIRSLILAAGTCPMYGTLFCIRHLIEKYLFKNKYKDQDWKDLIGEIIETCFEISETVSPVVNNSSPEGHLPMDLEDEALLRYPFLEEEEEDEEDDEGNVLVRIDESNELSEAQINKRRKITAQMILVCAWRSIKEISLLLGEITLNSTIASETESGLITEAQINKIGEHFTLLLTETKHRGAFEQAYVGFAKMCTRLWKCKSQSLHELPVNWLNDIIGAITDPNSDNRKLCATRRSAGVPFMIQAIVASEVQTGSSIHFHRCMKTLLELANHPGDQIEVRTHSMNILRALFRHTQFGEEIGQYTAEGLIVSITGFSRNTWAERNSATLLFASLMTRIFGVQRNKDSDQINIRNRMTARVFFMRNPTVHPFLLDQIQKLTNVNCEPYKLVALYPILLLLARLYPATNDEHVSDNLLQDFLPFVKSCANSKNLKTRELAAKAIVPLVPTDKQKTEFLKELFRELHKSFAKKNYMHGILLQIYYILPTITDFQKKFDICKIIENTSWVLTINEPSSSAIISALYMQIVSRILPKSDYTKTHKINEKQKVFEDLYQRINAQDKYVQTNCIVGKSLYNKESTYLQINLLRFRNMGGARNPSKMCNFLLYKMLTEKEDVIEIILNFFLYYLNEMNSTKRSYEYLLNSFEIPEEEKHLAQLFARSYKPSLVYKHLASRLHQKLHTIIEHICANFEHLINKAYLLMSFFKKMVLKEGVDNAYKAFFSALVKSVTSHDDQRASTMVVCLKLIVKYTEIFEFLNDIGLLDHIFEVLHECATPRHSTSCRYAVALMFSDETVARLLLERGHLNIGISNLTKKSRERSSSDFVNYNVMMAWKVIMQLSIDPDPVIRSKICELDKSRSIAEKSREVFMDKCIEYFRHISTSKIIHLLSFWCITDFEQIITDVKNKGPVFEKTETNPYVEDMYISRLSSQKLSTFVRCETIADFHTVFSRCLNILLMEQESWDADVDELITILEQFQREIVGKNGVELIEAIKTFVDSIYYGIDLHAKIKYICLGILPENFVWEE